VKPIVPVVNRHRRAGQREEVRVPSGAPGSVVRWPAAGSKVGPPAHV